MNAPIDNKIMGLQMTGYRQADIGNQPPNPNGSYIWENLLSDNGRDIVDPQRYSAAREAKRQEIFQKAFQEAAKRPPKHISPDEAIQRNVGFIVMDYGTRSRLTFC